MGVTTWGTLGSGVLSGKYNQDATTEGRATLWKQVDERSLTIAEAVIKVAAEVERSPAQVALNWVRQQPGTIIPLLGAKRLEQLQNNLACLDFTLSQEQLQTLSDVSRIELGFPHEFLASDGVRDLVFAGTFSQIDPA
jgi:aryl-alcohol dehydrogenase-like predicted oxidoreductase